MNPIKRKVYMKKSKKLPPPLYAVRKPGCAGRQAGRQAGREKRDGREE
jgi:hypothetical protein